MSTGSASALALANAAADSLYSGSIPAQADGAFIEYFISATDTDGLESTTPGDTSASLFFYFVRDAGLGIFDLQFTPFADGNSPYRGLDVTVSGIATTDSADFSFYFIQNGTDPWNGIWVQDNANNVKLGDSVSVTGTVEERFNATRINNVTSVTIHSSGNTVPEPVVVPTGDLAVAATGEKWEGMLVRVENVGVANPFADGSRNFGEFTVDDGSGEVRVDDLGNFRGNLDTAFVANDSLISLTGIHHFTFSNYKIEPRNDNDVIRLATSVETDEPVPFTFELSQNYPNPFNPETTIRYQVASPSEVKIQIYNILGQRVKTLVNAFQPTGAYTVQWRGTNDRGLPVSSGVYIYHMKASDFVQVKKMLFLK
ncbi:MAG: FlgD immunoglobulin-like domain containing protein [bacterium]